MDLPLYNGELNNDTPAVQPDGPDDHKVNCIVLLLAMLSGEGGCGAHTFLLSPPNRVPKLVEDAHPFQDLDPVDIFIETLDAMGSEGLIHQRLPLENHSRVYLDHRLSWRDIIASAWDDNQTLTMRFFLLAVRRVAQTLKITNFQNNGLSDHDCGLPEALELRRVRTFLIALTQSALPLVVKLELGKIFITAVYGLIQQALRLRKGGRGRVTRVNSIVEIMRTLAAIHNTLKDGAEISTEYESFCVHYSYLDGFVDILIPEFVQYQTEGRIEAFDYCGELGFVPSDRDATL